MKKTLLALAIVASVGAFAQTSSTQSTSGGTTTSTTGVINQGTYDSKTLVDTNSTSNSTSTSTTNSTVTTNGATTTTVKSPPPSAISPAITIIKMMSVQ